MFCKTLANVAIYFSIRWVYKIITLLYFIRKNDEHLSMHWYEGSILSRWFQILIIRGSTILDLVQQDILPPKTPLSLNHNCCSLSLKTPQSHLGRLCWYWDQWIHNHTLEWSLTWTGAVLCWETIPTSYLDLQQEQQMFPK